MHQTLIPSHQQTTMEYVDSCVCDVRHEYDVSDRLERVDEIQER